LNEVGGSTKFKPHQHR